MKDQFYDPGPDPGFPNRPDHPDFRRLSWIIQGLDADMDGGKDSFDNILRAKVDPASLIYLAEQRISRIAPIITPTLDFLLKALYLEAFIVGCSFTESNNLDDQAG